MAQVTLENKPEEVINAVQRYAQNRWNDNIGQLEELQREVSNLREIVARFIDLSADKLRLNEEELQKVIRGY